ncbi:hypothetical protein [Tsukamurella soli]|uniref:hypothetical protein n=1 Tax=Tsukamurella soli TaxID=644556 RepID=UPI0036222664
MDTASSATFQCPALTVTYVALNTASTGGTVTAVALLPGSGITINPAGRVTIPAGTITVS